MAGTFDPKAENDKFNVQQKAQAQKMGNADPALNPGRLRRPDEEANAGGQNREAGDRRARQNDRATNGGE